MADDNIESEIRRVEKQLAKMDVNGKSYTYDKREHLNIVFIGHVDAGKSTLGGQLLFITGMVDQRTIEKYEREAKEKGRESWFLAFVLDCGEDEREKGKTVEVGRAHFETEKKRYTILDAPGHRAYVPNMIGGAAQADVGVLVISARKGEFETGFEKGGQTREHATLAKTLGVEQLVVVINKMDDPSVEWSKERYDEITGKLTPFLKGIGYVPGKTFNFIPVSGYTGANLMNKIPESDCPWFSGPTFIDYLDQLPVIGRLPNGPLRIPIIDKYKERGTTVILGKVESGRIHVGQKCILMPNKTAVEVSRLVCHDDDYELVNPGDNVAIYLKADDIEVSTGHVLCNEASPCYPVKEFIGQFLVLDKPLFSAGYSAVLHIHTAVEQVTVTKFVAKLDKKTLKKMGDEKPKFGKTGELLLIVFELDKSVCLEKFETLGQMGRFTIRDKDKTIGIGKVTGIKPLN
jgi:peptide chain release factor subunit 3